ncbi:MAG: hypothetical protein KJ852_06205 [Gammaproteobacteria bacterium]|nr:hypothetical protein [Gammaproteobacteria bacterium]MBU0788757.1 hypothetical protein [Gammaproteobacteria bacterium]MBU0814623.1 hypothetical protein [Gammaproteobacteria bacterium]MBU1786534.1 hypothetical protein [Gammaproteobacteria bacterium]
MKPFVFYCKSYSVDVKRASRLAKTIKQFNFEKIPFYVSVPRIDIPLFSEYLDGLGVELIADETIINANPCIDKEKLTALPGNISQQVIKSEFWRLGISKTCLCLDSDCVFIRPFSMAEFITPEGTPYTIIDEGRDLLFPALSKDKEEIFKNFRRESSEVRKEFERQGKDYNFGPNCPVWDRRVWQSLDEEFLRPRNQTFLDLILRSPNEMRWYGEALLRYKAINLLPSQPFFKMYHYAWQLKKDQQNGIGISQLANLYCGVVYQSAWEREMDWPNEGGDWLSRMARRLRRQLGRA